jgi:hypothetical protein
VTVARLSGRVAGVPQARGGVFVGQGTRCAGQGAWARALMRLNAVTMSAAQGQLAWILSWRRRAPRVIRAAACRTL